jgi:hypothetical protein
VVVARLDHHGGARGAGQRQRPDPERCPGAHSSKSASLRPESSPFGMKPREPDSATRAPNSDASGSM